MLKKNKLYYWLFGTFITLDGFVLYGYVRRYFEFAILTGIFCLFLFDPYFGKNTKKNRGIMGMILILILLSGMQLFIGKYGGVYSLSITFVVVGSFSLFYHTDMKKIINNNYNKKFEWFLYLCMFASIFYQFYQRITENPAVVNNIYEIYYSLGRDKNVLGIIVFCFFCICFKKKMKLGVVLSIVFAAILGSRMLVLDLIIFIMAYIFRKKLYFLWNKFFDKKYWLAFLASVIVIVIFSGIFVAYCNIHGLGKYQEAWSDASNYMRMTSNLYALKKTVNDSYFILAGSDEHILAFLGVTEKVRFLGERVVQPHNDIINLYVRKGLVYSILYWGLIGKLFQTIVNEDNIYIFLAFFFSSMFIRPIFVGPQLLLVIYVLVLEENGKKFSRIVIKGKNRGKL